MIKSACYIISAFLLVACSGSQTKTVKTGVLVIGGNEKLIKLKTYDEK